jgi:receptor-binding and translocation channel-forming TcA subunit of Tc toxin/ABC toxin-like protein
MPALIIVGLHPSQPTDGGSFAGALAGLSITAYDLTFADSPGGVQIGTASGVAAVPALGDDTVDITKTAIMQHYVDVNDPYPIGPQVRMTEAAATAVIVVSPPAGHQEYPSPESYDLRLAITRNGQAIADQAIDFNIAVADVSSLSTHQPDYFAMTPAAYAVIPAAPPPGPLPPGPVTLPADGTPPGFADLVTAIDAVLAADPGGTTLATQPPLTMPQCQQIASELTWNRVVYPPPPLPRPLGQMYTKPAVDTAVTQATNGAQAADNDRQIFEAQLASYYATLDAQAARLATFVFAASAAVACEKLTLAAGSAGLSFPVLTGQPGTPAQASVLLTATAVPPPPTTPLDPAFGVPAAYFYATGATLPPTVGLSPPPGPRYDLAVYAPENKTLAELQTAIDAGVVSASEGFTTSTALTAIGPAQAARRLHALGSVTGSLLPVVLEPPVATLVTGWLGYTGDTSGIDQAFWAAQATTSAAAYLGLVLQVVTGNHAPLIGAITAAAPGTPSSPGLGVASVADLVAVADSAWTTFFLPPGAPPNIALLPPFTEPGTPAERVKAFLAQLRKFFAVPVSPVTLTPGGPGSIATLGLPPGDILTTFAASYAAEGGGTFTFGTAFDQAAFDAAVADTLPGDPAAQAWLAWALTVIAALYDLTSFAPPELRFSLMEALYARGFTAAQQVAALAAGDFQAALEGSAAYPYAGQIQQAAGGPAAPGTPPGGQFLPVNPDGSLTNCVPPEHTSPFGPVAYLAELLRASAACDCEHPQGTDPGQQIAALVAARRGPLADLHATRANTGTPLPAIDLVNESLEALTAAVAAGGPPGGGAVFDTGTARLAGHRLRHPGEEDRDAGDADGDGHSGGLDPAEAFAAIPEHSSPAAVDCPPAQTAAYTALRADFTAPALPYDQPLDICRSYLCQMGTTRFEAMRRFRRDITEFVLDPAPAAEPPGFERQLWRYPVVLEAALEYLGISGQEYALLFEQPMTGKPGPGQLVLWQVYGFTAPRDGRARWTSVVTAVPEFLRRTGLSYCELVDLQRSGFLPFQATDAGTTQQRAPGAPRQAPVTPGGAPGPAATTDSGGEGMLPHCEPCCLDSWSLALPGASSPQGPVAALYQLIVFIRLWRRLRERAWCGLGFGDLAKVGQALELFGGSASAPVVNPDFARQLAALLMLRDNLRVDPLALLPLWAAPGGPGWDAPVAALLHGIGEHARSWYGCREREPEFAKVLAPNLDPLSVLAGFDPATAGDTWHALPTHTLRFSEVLGKIYASEFSVGELLFLFTAGPHTDGDDPFPLADANETADDPLALPEATPAAGDGPHSLWALRRALLRAEPGEDEIRGWGWDSIAASLSEEFGYTPPGTGTDPLTELAGHFFPSVLERAGHTVPPAAREYRTPLASASTSPLMWNGQAGPFHYDQAAQQLCARLPLADAAVIGRLREMRPLNHAEQAAVRELYFAPRAALAAFSPVFENFAHAADFMTQACGDEERFAFFQRQFALFHARCAIIAAHLAAHVSATLRRGGDGGGERHGAAWRVLRALLADGNLARGPWEADSGEPPEVTWGPAPAGGAFAALLGLTGTGLLGEFGASGGPAWRELRGPLTAFGRERDETNSPVPTVLPSPGLRLSAHQLHVAGIRNGYAMADADGTPLGGAEPFCVSWRGVLLVERHGEYRFYAGAPAQGKPDAAAARHNRWRVTVCRGQKTQVVLSHGFAAADDDAPAGASGPVALRRGAYQISVEFEQREPRFTGPQAACPAHTGFEVAYAGPDTRDRVAPLPLDKLFRPFTAATLSQGLPREDTSAPDGLPLPAAAAPVALAGSALAFLDRQYVPDLRDIRRTYQRAFKALLLAQRFGLSARPLPRYRESELGYLLSHPGQFAGTSYYRTGPGSFGTHHAWLDLDLLPVADPSPPPLPPGPPPDQRGYPSPARQAALFGWWERLFDYCWLRRRSERAMERPPWLLFSEASEDQPDNPAELLRHLGVDLRAAPLAVTYFSAPAEYTLGPLDLADERWAVRAWHAWAWLRRLCERVAVADLGRARPSLWASDDPAAAIAPGVPAGNANLTRFFADSCLADGRPRRYLPVRQLNDGLRERARAALLAYLCGMDRVPLPWPAGSYARTPGDLSGLLLQDTETGLCTRMSRVADAVRAVQAYVQQARLGREPGFTVSPAFSGLWEKRFASYAAWQACRRREIYTENWAEWEELRAAHKVEAFRFLADGLRRATLTAAVPGGLVWWPDGQLPAHPSLPVAQDREPSGLALVASAAEGLGLLASPERAASPSWLAPVTGPAQAGTSGGPGGPPGGPPDGGGNGNGPRRGGAPGAELAVVATAPTIPAGGQLTAAAGELPLWLAAAAGLGRCFVRVAAAGIPPASAHLAPPEPELPCCAGCGQPHEAAVDEYYFWLAGGSFFSDGDPVTDADAGIGVAAPSVDPSGQTSYWHQPDKLPGLLAWPPRPMVFLYWTRVHNGEFAPPRRSTEGVPVDPGFLAPGNTLELDFMGRTADSLRFQLGPAAAVLPPPPGYTDPSPAGFRYDLACDTATALPEVTGPQVPAVSAFPGGLTAYPYFAFVSPGAPVEPLRPHAVAFAVAAALRTRCRHEAALRWYELAYPPLARDDTWALCPPAASRDGAVTDGTPVAGPRQPRQDGACCPTSPAGPGRARDRAVLLCYLETLLQWGDAVACQGSVEAAQQAEVIFETMARILGAPPVTVAGRGEGGAPVTLAGFQPSPAPLNPRLLALYRAAADRQAMIRRCLSGRRLRIATPRGGRPFWSDPALGHGWQETASRCEGEPCQAGICADGEDLCCCGPYRFSFLVRNALELAGEVRALGASLLSACERGDAEALAALHAAHDRQLAELMLTARQHSWREADWQAQALGKTKQGAQARLRYYQQLLAGGKNAGETGYEALTGVSIGSRTAGDVLEAIAQGIGVIPDMWVGIAGIAGTPVELNQLPVGNKLAAGFSTAARIMAGLAEIASSGAGLSLTEGGWDRRTAEWQLQTETIAIEIDQIERQILAAQRRRDAALRDLNDQQRQLEHAAELQDFLRDKFTGGELYLYLQRETAGLHRQMYELALHASRRAQHAFNRERGHTARRFLPEEGWDGPHEGLLAAERLQLALRQMEGAYLDLNCREYELTKHLSLRLDFPLAFLHLQREGWAEIEIPEWMFDLDYPGHYLRRIKNVTVTIPCVAGPYTGVHCRLTLLESGTRTDPTLAGPRARCCDEDADRERGRERDRGCTPAGCGCAREQRHDGYLAVPGDPRIVREYAATEAIATSSGQNDGGVFELSFRDDRYLPFEFAGAVSRWRIELPPDNNFFDLGSLSDLVIHMNYTAREGGEALRRAAGEQAQRHLPGGGIRLFDVRHDLPDAWAVLTHQAPGGCGRPLPLLLGREHFPYLPHGRDVQITALGVFAEVEDPDCRASQQVRLVGEHHAPHTADGDCRCDAAVITCVASPQWPRLYHGVLEGRLPVLHPGGPRDLGELWFPGQAGRITRLYLACAYQAR